VRRREWPVNCLSRDDDHGRLTCGACRQRQFVGTVVHATQSRHLAYCRIACTETTEQCKAICLWGRTHRIGFEPAAPRTRSGKRHVGGEYDDRRNGPVQVNLQPGHQPSIPKVPSISSAQRYGVQRRRASAVRCNALFDGDSPTYMMLG